MIQQTFGTSRPILVRVDDTHISFHFTNENEREFYWICKQDWVRDYSRDMGRGDNFHVHMTGKKWFTKPMYEFLNEACGLTKTPKQVNEEFSFRELISECQRSDEPMSMKDILFKLYFQ